MADARALMGANKYDEAAKQFEAYLATNRFDGRAWAAYASCLHLSKQYDRSIPAGRVEAGEMLVVADQAAAG